MKEGYLIKSKKSESLSQDELTLINQYTRRELSADEVYVFSVVLCDNDIDRDFEKFTEESLHELSRLFVGKTGIFDHEMKSENQTARIFSCKVEYVEGKVTQDNQPYCRLVARAYIPKSEKNEGLILDIDSGIKKEVSVGCSISKAICSICGADMKLHECNHQKGRFYEINGARNLCYAMLCDPMDAYEWSFVAVPAQKEAGVIKTHIPQSSISSKFFNSSVENIVKKLNSGEEVYISKEQAINLSNFISELDDLSKYGKSYKEELINEVIKISTMVNKKLPVEIMENVTKKMSLEELKAFKNAFSSELDDVLPVKPQLISKQGSACNQNAQFKI